MSYGKPEITHNRIKCEECGKWVKKIVPPHVKMHGLTFAEYKKKWGFCNSQPLEAGYIKEIRQYQARALGHTRRLNLWRKENKKEWENNSFKHNHDQRRGMPRSEQELEHLKSIAINVQHTDKFKEAHSVTSKKKWQDKEYQKNVSAGLKKLWNKPERRKQLSEQSKRFWRDPENVKKMSALRKKIWNTSEKKKYASERSKRYWSSRKSE